LTPTTIAAVRAEFMSEEHDHSHLIRDIVAAARAQIAARPAFRASYRLQFHGGFRFGDAKEIASYLGELGVSHVYSSPVLKAHSGSTHGYDVVDHSRVNDELGTQADFDEYVRAIRRHQLGHLLDIVPNHMSVAGDENAWWMDVLMNGPASPYAAYFDVDWRPIERELSDKVLLPVLGDLYGNVLEAGQLPVMLRDGAFFVSVGQSFLPLDPRTWPRILSPHLDEFVKQLGAESQDVLELQSIITALQHLPERTEVSPERLAERQRERGVVQGRLRRLSQNSPDLRQHIERNLTELNGQPGDPRSFDALDELLNAQAFQLVLWKAGSDEINYRRFFDVTELAAVCTENLDVFEDTHKLLLDFCAEGKVDGFRIDHIDGLFDPVQYLWRLQWASLRELGRAELARRSKDRADLPQWSDLEPGFFEALAESVGGPDPKILFRKDARPEELALPAERPANGWGGSLFVLVEKILGADEPLPTAWPVKGTTGYDFVNLVNGLFVDPGGLSQIQKQYVRFTGRDEPLAEIMYDCKRLILSASMQSEVQLLAHRLDRLSNRHRKSRDYTLQSLRFALRELIASFPVYRTYITSGQISDRDRRIVALTVALARRRNPAAESSVFTFLRDVLLLEQPPDLNESGQTERDFFIGRFQQVTSPVMAKGVEDTAFYQYLPLVSLEEVGGDPEHGVKTVEEFHRQNEVRAREWPSSMLATSTHDTKRAEDVRARINVLTEIPAEWRGAFQRFSKWNKKHRREADGESAPSRNDEWLFYQTLVGMWPWTMPGPDELQTLIKRLQNYMEKATHEAKLRTSWITPHPDYDQAVREFVAATLGDPGGRFVADLEAFNDTILNSGLYSSLSQVLLKLTAPGFPDIYQGQELWDFSLVDPDNRRPVDYEKRRTLLAEIQDRTSTPEGRRSLAAELAQNPRDERTKLFATWSILQLRKQRPGVFQHGEYRPLEVQGSRAAHVCVFQRTVGSETAVIVAPRLFQRLKLESASVEPLGEAVWQSAALVGIEGDGRPLTCCLTGQTHIVENGTLLLKNVLNAFPISLLTN
jgi:(1->4)-alpha-D-glucan 1-alpha-D-glucosylmutase